MCLHAFPSVYLTKYAGANAQSNQACTHPFIHPTIHLPNHQFIKQFNHPSLVARLLDTQIYSQIECVPLKDKMKLRAFTRLDVILSGAHHKTQQRQQQRPAIMAVNDER